MPNVKLVSSQFEDVGVRKQEIEEDDIKPVVLVRKQFAHALVQRCSFRNVNDAIATTCKSCIVSNSFSVANTAIWVSHGNHGEDSHCSSEILKNTLDCCDTGILITRIPQVLVEQNQVENFRRAIVLLHLKYASRVEANAIQNGKGTGISVLDSPAQLISNTLTRPGLKGIIFEGEGRQMPEFAVTDA